jgi:hypothetical protein
MEAESTPELVAATSEDNNESSSAFSTKPEVSYPLTVIYCGNCGLPPEVFILFYSLLSLI